MPQDSPTSPQVATGLIVKDSPFGVALFFLVVALILTAAGVLAVHAWWTGKLFFGIKLAGYGGLIGVGGVVAGLYAFASLINTFLQQNYLVIGDDCFQQVQYGKVIVQIPFANISQVDYGEHSLLGKYVSFSVVNPNDGRTVIADWLRQRDDSDFQIADAGWQMPLPELYEELEGRVHARAAKGVGPAVGRMK